MIRRWFTHLSTPKGLPRTPSVEREDFFLLAGGLVPYKRPDTSRSPRQPRAGARLVVAETGDR